MLTVILRDENESAVRKRMCGRGFLKAKNGWNKCAGRDVKPTQRGNFLSEFCKSPSEIIAKSQGDYHELDIRKTGSTRRI